MIFGTGSPFSLLTSVTNSMLKSSSGLRSRNDDDSQIRLIESMTKLRMKRDFYEELTTSHAMQLNHRLRMLNQFSRHLESSFLDEVVTSETFEQSLATLLDILSKDIDAATHFVKSQARVFKVMSHNSFRLCEKSRLIRGKMQTLWFGRRFK